MVEGILAGRAKRGGIVSKVTDILESFRERPVVPGDMEGGSERPAPPLRENSVPDYAAFCPDYFQGCFRCPHYSWNKIRFCRRWNQIYPETVAEFILDDTDGQSGDEQRTFPGRTSSWWSRKGKKL